VKKVIVYNPMNEGRGKSLRPPFGLLTIASVLIENGVEVVWIDGDVLRNEQAVYSELQKHLDSCMIMIGALATAYGSVKRFYSYLESENITIPTLLGGRIAWNLDEILYQNIPNLDMMCRQEGEHVIRGLIDKFPDRAAVDGIEYVQNGKVVVNTPAKAIEAYHEVPEMCWDLLDDIYFKQKKVPTAFLLTGRGCPFNCSFCRTADAPVESYRAMPVERIIAECFELAAKRGVRHFYISDEFFLQNKKRVLEFCESIQETQFSWQCTARANSIKSKDFDLLVKMKASGCLSVSIGFESGSQIMLDAMNKRLDIKQAEEAVETLRAAKIPVSGTFIFGFPGETIDTALESARWRRKMGLLGRPFFATPIPGSELYKHWKKLFSISLEDEEAYILDSPSIKKESYNFTELPEWRFKLLYWQYLWVMSPKHVVIQLWRRLQTTATNLFFK